MLDDTISIKTETLNCKRRSGLADYVLSYSKSELNSETVVLHISTQFVNLNTYSKDTWFKSRQSHRLYWIGSHERFYYYTSGRFEVGLELSHQIRDAI